MYAQVARYCNRSADLIPLSFVLGKFKAQGVLPCSPLAIFPDLWAGLLALRVSISPAAHLEVNQSRLSRQGSCVPGPGFPEDWALPITSPTLTPNTAPACCWPHTPLGPAAELERGDTSLLTLLGSRAHS